MYKRSTPILFLLIAAALGASGCSYFNKKPVTRHSSTVVSKKEAAADAAHQDMTTKAIIDGTMGK